MAIKETLDRIREEALSAIKAADAESAIEDLRVRYLGKKGELTAILKQMGTLPAEERPLMGQLSNDVRKDIEALIAERSSELRQKAQELRFRAEALDVTLPGTDPHIGSRHPLETVLDDIKEIFLGMGFNVAEGPEVEFDHYCFEMLNMPKHHPARDT
ncbi:MAG: phenylalanine--tRNA ligase subunit alpha, partial [Oscillospiraceae bacterium]|nr:phenylalanine--tRNA ligase subunit alpha [Oscillospiraceae bacterium]